MTKKKVILEIRRGNEIKYLVLSTVNCLSPVAGTVISKLDAETLIDDGFDVTIKNPKRI